MNWAELLNWQEYIKLLIGLMALTNPLGALPVFLSATKKQTQTNACVSRACRSSSSW
jgi:small neutral amino acid transporter SnatA (MarC family)